MTPPWTCAGCAVTRDKPEKRMPSGWKRRESLTYCQNCWRERYLLRAVAAPVASPLDCTWKELNAILRKMWQDTTAASNWIVSELFSRDVQKSREDERIPSMERVYLYPEIRKRWPDLQPRSAAALENTLQATYRAIRFDLWNYKRSLPSFRYPVPVPVPSQGWSIEFENNAPVVSARLGNERMRLRLQGGPRFRRQRRMFEQLALGVAISGEMSIYRKSDRCFVKLVAWLPRATEEPNKKERSGILRVRTAADTLLVALSDKEEVLWRHNADHVKRWQAEHRRQLQRWNEDAKYEQRPEPSFADRRAAAVRKYHHRMDTACHEIAAQLAGYADRRRFAAVVYDDSVRDYCAGFPYTQLALKLREKLDALGISFDLGGSVPEANLT